MALAVLLPARPTAASASTTLSAFVAPGRTTTLTSSGRARLQAASWWGGAYTAPTGETVTVYVSDSYPVDQSVGQGWANFFAGLVHGSELQLLRVYVAKPAEVQELCGSQYSLGCYGSDQLVVPGEPSSGIDPKEIATHEYGHHIAFNRLNPPWTALDWGAKRWASYEGICRRVAQGTAFPGDEGDHYRENPGEAFAETYRVMNDAKTGDASLPWNVVDGSFYPDQGALQAVEQDVTSPWTSATTKVVAGQFAADGTRVWNLQLAAPLDGSLDATLSLPKGALYKLSLLDSAGKVLASGLWTGSTQRRLSYTICGQRSLDLRVKGIGRAGRFTLRYTQP